MNSSGESQKLVPLTGEVLKAFDELKTKRLKDSDYVFDICDVAKSDTDNQQVVHAATQTILNRMNSMLGDEAGFRFVIKRIRPTAAVVAAEIGGITYVRKLLMHSNIRQTSTYLAIRPQSMFIDNHRKFEEMSKSLPALESD
jgi:integrase